MSLKPKSPHLCKEDDCTHESTSAGFCRIHFMKLLMFEKKLDKNIDLKKIAVGENVRMHDFLDVLESEKIESLGAVEVETDESHTSYVNEIYKRPKKKTG